MTEVCRPSPIVFIATFAALLGAVGMGIALGYTAPTFLELERETESPILDVNKNTRERQKSLIGSMLAVGGLTGGMLAEPSNKFLGRRVSLILFGIPYIIGWLLLSLASEVSMLVLGRLFTGLACGLVSGTAPTYVVEIAPAQIRGLLGICFQLMCVIGTLLVALFGTFLNWRELAGWSITTALGMSILMLFMPETPQWLLMNDRYEEAEKALDRLRIGSTRAEFKFLSQEIMSTKDIGGHYSCELIKSSEFYRPTILALGLMFFQQFSGINAVLFYQSDIFREAAPNSDALQSTIWVCSAQVVATLIGSFLIDRCGRKFLLLLSGVGLASSLITLGFYLHISSYDKEFQTKFAWIALVTLILFVFFFSIGHGPVPWMMIPEFSSSRVRSLVASIGTSFTWTGAYVVTATIKPIFECIGNDWTYWTLACICISSCFFVFLFIPETKGKSSEQIQKELLGMSQCQSIETQNNETLTSASGVSKPLA